MEKVQEKLMECWQELTLAGYHSAAMKCQVALNEMNQQAHAENEERLRLEKLTPERRRSERICEEMERRDPYAFY